ncbi:gamma-glutamyl-gamma-aminobutyrate hydrolase family protein [Pelagibius litoralis]|uniref:gamma-glutamyl-gamma-aminobutyrate hydrolase n=1 Tax=Pelagibius litoralis TaxID=374515 RepID=A0A967EXL3_9PROT|nr:gamma-glutamyl-gamma-aminobutyrate hydrolase family protein [Pelagibius litoralis]NIA69279.1 gamma-glutamyl-gamma-aminobutyrate hydrolase family protein [Pelagibius litoralis]
MKRPLVGITADFRTHDSAPYHVVGDKYARAIWEAAGCTPLIIPAMAESQEVSDMLDSLDGLMFTGSPSNVHPTRYGRDADEKAEPYDEARDAMTFGLIDRALEKGLPSLFVCRGFQELNAALGGTLHACVHEVEGRMDHRMPKHDDPDVRYGPRHAMNFTPGSLFAGIAGASEIEVNSLHSQGIDVVAPGLEIEGHAPDGTPEAVSVTGAKAFALGVQWHPEYKALENDFSTRLFRAFSEAVRG